MKLRMRLAVAFLLMSVVPLTAITLYSYNSTIRAFRRAVEAEESAIAADMAKRMELVTSTVSERVDRVSAAARARDWNERDQSVEQQFRQQVAATLGDAGNYVSKLQFIPSAPPPPPPPAERPPRPRYGSRGTHRPPPPGVPARPAATPAPPAVPASPDSPTATKDAAAAAKVAEAAAKIIDLIPTGSMPPDAQAALATAKELTSTLPQIAQLKDLSGAAFQEAARAFEERYRAIERNIEAERRTLRREHIDQWINRMKAGRPMDIPVQREGRMVGTVNAEISLPKVLDSVLAGRSAESGEIAFALDTQNNLYVRGRRDRQTLQSLGLIDRIRNSKAPVQTVTDDNWIVVARRDPSGIVFGIARPVGTALGEIRRASGRNLGLGLLAVLVALVGIIPVSGRMTRNLSVLHTAARKIAGGDLNVRVPVKSKDEIGNLAAAFNQMAQDLGAHQKLIAERERLRGELELCRQIQTEMLPKEPLRLGFADIKGVSIPAREVGGDFFNYFLMPQGEVAVLVGDVSGKGVGAALLMANVQATLRARLALERDLAGLASTIDREIDEATPKAVYLTLFMGILDATHRVLRYVNAGHNPQFVLRADGSLDKLPSTGLPIAMFPGHGYTESSVTLGEGDSLFFYTDGVTEAENEKGEMFGSDRLERLLLAHHEEGADVLIARIEQEVLAFRGAADLFDDATMMVLRLGHQEVTDSSHRL